MDIETAQDRAAADADRQARVDLAEYIACSLITAGEM